MAAGDSFNGNSLFPEWVFSYVANSFNEIALAIFAFCLLHVPLAHSFETNHDILITSRLWIRWVIHIVHLCMPSPYTITA